MADITRRDFVKKAAGGIAAATAAGPLGAMQALGQATVSLGPKQYFDYIIIGSGAGGGTLACRLAQRKKRVLLIEAGGPAGETRTEYPIFHPKEPTAHAWSTEDAKLAWAFYVKHYRFKVDPKKRAFHTNPKDPLFGKPFIDPDSDLYDYKKGGILYPRGSTVGGSTAINAMITLYPDGRDWDWIGDQTGDRSWNADAMYNDYFKRFDARQFGQQPENPAIEAVRPWLKPWFNNERGNPWLVALEHDTVTMRILYATIHGVYFSTHRQRKDALEFFAKYSLEKALNLLDTPSGSAALRSFKADLVKIYNSIDPNSWSYVEGMYRGYQGGISDGMIDIPRATLKGRRWGTRDMIEEAAQLLDEQGKPYLKVETNCFVKRIAFEENPNRRRDGRRYEVAGIEWVRGGRLYGARIGSEGAQPETPMYPVGLNKGGELILSAGTFNTPQLLMLSGVGPFDEMPRDLPRYVDLPGLGKNLQDRYEVCVIHKLDRPLGVLEKCKIGDMGDTCFDTWNTTPESSIYGSNGALAALAKTSTPRQRENGSPDMIIFALSGQFPGYRTDYSKAVVGERSDDPKKDTRGKYLTWAVLKGHTDNNAGEVKLRSSSPYEQPYINFHSFEEGYDPKEGTNLKWQDDLQAMLEGTQFVRKELREKLRIVPRLHGRKGWSETLPEPRADGKPHDDDSIRTWIQQRAWGHHACGTAPMGRSLAADPKSVVDSEFRVHGIKSLRIVDASVFKRIPGLFIVVPTYLMAEKAVDAIAGPAR